MPRTQWDFRVKPIDTIPKPTRPEKVYNSPSPRNPRPGQTAASQKAQANWKDQVQKWKVQTGQIAYTDVRGSQQTPRGGTIEGTIPGFRGGDAAAQEYAFNLQREAGAIQRIRTTARSTQDRTPAPSTKARFKRDRRGTVRGNVGSLRI